MLLRPLEVDDHALLLPFAMNEPDLWQYSFRQVDGSAGLKEYLRSAQEDRVRGTGYPFIVYDKRAGAYAGSTRFYDIQPAHATLLLGYTWYGSAYQGTGLNAHCKFLLLRSAFEHSGAQRVEFRADARNARSLAAMERLGCRKEGLLRSHLPDGTGGRRDTVVLSILRAEWYESVRPALEATLRGGR